MDKNFKFKRDPENNLSGEKICLSSGGVETLTFKINWLRCNFQERDDGIYFCEGLHDGATIANGKNS